MSTRYVDQEGICVDGRMMPRIPYYPLPWGELEATCGACGVPPGRLHVRGCDREMCLTCGDEFVGCGCIV